MEDHDTPEAVTQRDSQIDPIAMYLIVRESLNMGMGKTAAQCAHAAQMLQLEHQKSIDKSNNMQSGLSSEGLLKFTASDAIEAVRKEVFETWLRTSFRKIVLKADDKEWEKIKEHFKDYMVIVVDSGLTEVPNGSETVIGLFPMYKSQAPKIIKKLQALK